MRDPEDQKVLEQAMAAIDSSIRTLVVAQMMLEDRYEAGKARQQPPSDPLAQLRPEVDQSCQHENQVAVEAFSGSQQICADCGENLGMGGE